MLCRPTRGCWAKSRPEVSLGQGHRNCLPLAGRLLRGQPSPQHPPHSSEGCSWAPESRLAPLFCGPTDLMGCVCAQPPSHHPYQLVNSREGVVRVVQGVDQLVYPIVGLTVSIETDTHCSATSKTPNKGDVTCREYTYLPLCTRVCACAPGGQERMLVPSSIALCIIPLGQSLSLSLEFTERTMLAASELSLVPIPSAGIAEV